MHEYGHLFYTKIYESDLRLFVEHDVPKHAQRLYLFLGLNWNTYGGSPRGNMPVKMYLQTLRRATNESSS